MNTINTYRGIVYPWNCDHMGHMNVQFYIARFDEASWALFNQSGLTASYFKKNNTGMVALEQHVKYYKEVLAGDSIYIESKIIETRDKTVLLKHLMFNDANKELVAETKITGLHIDTALRKAALLPQIVKERLCNFNRSNP